MTTLAAARQRKDNFFLTAAIVMAIIVIAGFSLQYMLGRSTFASPLRVHIHAIVFMGWIAIFVTQNILVARGAVALHRRLGWIAAGWVVAMVIMGFVVTIAIVRNGMVPFFFKPLQFLIFDPMTVLTFALLTALAIARRRQTDWHQRLHYCAMALIITPAFGRLLPMPLLAPYAFEATVVCTAVLIGAGMIHDLRRDGVVHRSWVTGASVIAGAVVLIEALAYGPLGVPIYRAATAGSPGASVAPLELPPPPSGPLRTGRPPAM